MMRGLASDGDDNNDTRRVGDNIENTRRSGDDIGNSRQKYPESFNKHKNSIRIRLRM